MIAMHPITVNTTELEIRRAREAALGGFGLDAKRPTAWTQYGWRENLTFTDYLLAYERGGAGFGAVHRLLDKCWQERPRIKQPEADKETPWETSVNKVLTAINGWQKLRDLDRRNMVGRYAALIYRVADGKPVNEPIATAARLVDLVPVWESQIEVQEWDTDTNSETYGQPKMFRFETAPPTDRDNQARPRTWLKVHPSRVQILAEGSVGGNFTEGVPLLRAGFNSLTDLEKITGGSAEGFLKNSARAVTFSFDKDASPQVITTNPDGTASGKTVREVIEEQVDGLNRSIDKAIVTQGATVGTLNTQMVSPEHAFDVAANLFAASVQIPMTILFGAQTGRLASDEDRADMNARCKSRQLNELTPMLEELIRRLQAMGLVQAGEFEIEWPQLDAPGDDGKATLLGKMTAAAQQAFQAGITEPLFDANELRDVMDFEPRADDGMPTEGDPAQQDPNVVDPKADPAAKPALKAV